MPYSQLIGYFCYFCNYDIISFVTYCNTRIHWSWNITHRIKKNDAPCKNNLLSNILHFLDVLHNNYNRHIHYELIFCVVPGNDLCKIWCKILAISFSVKINQTIYIRYSCVAVFDCALSWFDGSSNEPLS